MPPTSSALAMPIPLSTVSFTPPPHLSLAAILALGSIVLGRTVLLLWSRLGGGTFDTTLVELFAREKLDKLAQPVPYSVKDLEAEALQAEAMQKLSKAEKLEKPAVPPRPSPKAKPERTQVPADVYLTDDEIMSILYTSATFRESTSVLGYAPDPLLPPLIEVDEE